MPATQYPEPDNAAGFLYEPGSEETKLLKAALIELESTVTEIPSIINGERLYTGRKSHQTNPWNRHAPLAEYHEVDAETITQKAIPGGLEARKTWSHMPFKDRAAIWKTAANLVASPKYRFKLMAATMLGQGKTVGQADGDCITEVIDTLIFHVHFTAQLYEQQPIKQFESSSSKLDYRPLEGFVLGISPFNFTALGAHIALTPALLGNVVLWKPSPMAVLSNYILYQIMEEAGLPKGVIQFLPVADPATVVSAALRSPDFAGLHYTGSSAVLRDLCTHIGVNTKVYRSIPRIVGESGGKNFHLVHNSCRDEDVQWIASAAARSAFEFQGQKCSALSRLYVPRSMWEQGGLKRALIEEAKRMTHGEDVKELDHPFGPLISEASFKRFHQFVQRSKEEGHELIYGGSTDGSKGFFVQPAIFEVNPASTIGGKQPEILTKELFGPLIAVQVYDDATDTAFTNTCHTIDSTSEYGLAGSVFARNREAIKIASEKLRDSVGMFVINDKSTGAVIGAHPFGGARSSGTNDKANSVNVLLRFSSIRTIKESYPQGESPFAVKHLICTVGTAASHRRVEEALSEHASNFTAFTAEYNTRAVEQADLVILAFKPVKRADVFAAPGFKEALRGKLVLSIMAGVTTEELARLAQIEDKSDGQLQLIRAMPNMAARIREAVTLYTSSPSTTPSNLKIADWIFRQVGEAHQIPEKMFDICAVLVGCAGSLLLLAIDGLLDAAVAEGVKRPEVQNLVVNSAIGMMKLVPAGDHPSVLREKIASPGGCSIRALLELEKLGVRSAFTTAILKAAERSKEISSLW
ncbi:Aldehyde/histidinol dehydrogenase [Aspergillus granulosus]|uniref:L-glutamate gamma-semialdehyde dehydrogenase n=1 Tax=Aspergillus granulosus TaxID=176169 RepID=A0ABR4HJR0_9EURO